jgi:hypothetical protein
MVDWVVSPRSAVAFLDLTDGPLASDDLGRLVGALSSYYERRQIRRVVVRARGTSAVADALIGNLKAQAKAHEVGIEIQLDA